MIQTLQSRFWMPLLLVLSLVVPGVCGFIPEAHACCHGQANPQTVLSQLRFDTADQSCCFISTTSVSTSLQDRLVLPEPLSWVSPFHFVPFQPQMAAAENNDSGMQAQRFIADASNRHQLLQVWLN